MCSDTKGRIAEAVEQMLQTKPVCKITVQSVMEQTQMKRQSFYYHYQDIYNVLEWIVETEESTPLTNKKTDNNKHIPSGTRTRMSFMNAMEPMSTTSPRIVAPRPPLSYRRKLSTV